MKSNWLNFTPLGGVAEIGSNMSLFESEDEQVVVDCGLLFPYEEVFDINYLIPSFNIIDASKLKCLFVTHGHEDHIGAIIHFIKYFPTTPVYASCFTSKLILKKCTEFKIKPVLIIYDETFELGLKGFVLKPLHVTHSIPETFGVMIRTHDQKWGGLYISDFKFDLNPSFEKPFDTQGLINFLGHVETRIYFIDSTNVLKKEKTPSETDLVHDLDEIISDPAQRIFMTLFASNIFRLKTVLLLAKKYNRDIHVSGRSMESYLQAALEAGIADDVKDIIEEIKAQSPLSDKKKLILVSGCQGDYKSALNRIANGDDSQFKLNNEDLFVFSSKIIPGNEKKIYRIYNKLAEKGVRIISASDKSIHASGHPGQEDLLLLTKTLKPHFYVPIHGETFFLKFHQEWIKKIIPDCQVIDLLNYKKLQLFTDKKFKVQTLDVIDPLLIHGKGIEIERSQISERRKMATTGHIFITFLPNKNIFKFSLTGLPLFLNNHLESIEKNILYLYKNELIGRNEDYVKEQLRIKTRQLFYSFLGYKPFTSIHLIYD